MRIQEATPLSITNLWASVESHVRQARSLGQAAQVMSKDLYLRFDESVALARVFVTARFDSLPAKNREFVRNLAQSAAAERDLQATTPVLSLLGTYGDQEE